MAFKFATPQVDPSAPSVSYSGPSTPASTSYPGSSIPTLTLRHEIGHK